MAAAGIVALLFLILSWSGLQRVASVRAETILPGDQPERGQRAEIQAEYLHPGPDRYIPLKQITVVGGAITTDTVWSGEVLIEDPVVVEAGATLTVQPGTTVKFKHYRGYREPEKRLSLQVLGTLIVSGTATSPVYFTSDAVDPANPGYPPQNGDWSMLQIHDSADSVLQYFVIEFGQQGLNVWNGSPEISHCVVRWHNWEGMYFESYSTPTIKYCHLVENGYNGLAAEQYNTIRMDYSEIERSGTNGFHIDASTAVISRSRVHHNNSSGLSVDNNGSLSALSVASYDNHGCGLGIGEGNNGVISGNLSLSSNSEGEVCGSGTITDTTSPYALPAAIDIGFTPAMSYALGYIPGDRNLDKYQYIYPDDETRQIVEKMGDSLGLTWSLAWDGQYLWTAALWGDIYKLDPATGEVFLQTFKAPGSQPWGMTYLNGHLWIVDFAEKSISQVDPAAGTVLNTYPTPDPVGGCKGVTTDGQYLYVMGWTSPTVYKMTVTGTTVTTMSLDHGGGGGIAWDGQHFWIPGGGRILKYDSQGRMVGWIYATSEGTWDMTWDDQYLWATQRTNENWFDDKIFALKVLDDHDYPLYVDGSNPTSGSGSPSDPYQTIAQAVGAASPGEMIRVAQGTYQENLVINKQLDLFGGYASYSSSISWTRSLTQYETIIDGHQSGSVVTLDGGHGSILDGFTITGGQVDQAGGGLTIDNVSASIRSCRIEGNKASDSSSSHWTGGGLLIDGGQADVLISNTIIANNSALSGTGASGIRVGDSSLTLVNSLLVGQTGQATIHANSASLTMTHVTLSDNDAGYDSLFLNNSQAIIWNSILWENGPDIYGENSSYTVTYSNLEDGVLAGNGNISTNPAFIDAANGDYHLQTSSPCIDAGTSTGAPLTDLEGQLRDSSPDMGAYEWSRSGVYLPVVLKHP